MIKLFGYPINDLAARQNSVDGSTSLYGQTSSTNSINANLEPRNIISYDSSVAEPIVLVETRKISNGTGSLVYRYKIKYMIDYIQAIKANAFSMNVHLVFQPFGFGHAADANPNIAVNASLNKQKLNPIEIINSILTNQAKTLDYVNEERTSSILLTYDFDLGAKLSNSDLTALKASLSLVEFTNELPKFLQREYETIRQSIASKYGIDPTNIDVNKFAGTNEELNFMTSDKNTIIDNQLEMYSRYLFEVLKDPSELTGTATKNVSTAVHSFNGLISGIKNFDSNASNANMSLIPDIAGNPLFQQIRSNILNLTNESLNSDRDISEQEFITVPVIKEYTKKPVVDYIDIPENLIKNSNFFLQFEVLDIKGQTVQMFASNVRHQFMAGIMKTPTIPPKILSFPKGIISKNVFNIKQLDPNGSKVKIYRKEMSRTLPSNDAFYQQIAEISCPYGSDFVRYVDVNAPSSNPMAYRFTSVNSENAESSTFSSYVVQNNKKILDKESGTSNKSRLANIYAQFDKTTSDGLVLKISNLPHGSVSFSVTKRYVQYPEKQIETVVANYKTTSISSDAAVYTITDTNVRHNDIYEYRVAIIYRDGTVKYSKNNCFVQYKKVQQNVINTKITDIVTTKLSNESFDVSFVITKEPLQKDQDLLKKFLEKQGYDTLFINNLLNSTETSKLSSLFATEIYRVNLDSSEEEYYGIVYDDTFSESKFGSVAGVSPVQEGNYMYRIITYARRPETMFTSNVITVTPTNGQQSYTYKPSKYRHPYTLSAGTLLGLDKEALQGEFQLSYRNHSNSEWTLGDVVDIDNVFISIPNQPPNIATTAAFNSINDVVVVLEWTMKGDINKVDHFVVSRRINKTNQIIGKVHNLGEKAKYTYLDKIDKNIKGGINYFITQVMFDGSMRSSTIGNTVII